MPVVLLDSYHLGDPLFLTSLARDLQARGEGIILVHGSGERGERALEALGAVPHAAEGVWAVQNEEQALVLERTTRDLNREIVHELNEAGVSSTRVLGADRGLLKSDGNGAVHAGRTGWVSTLIAQRVVVVVAALVAAPGSAALQEVDAGHAAAALAQALGEPVIALAKGALPGHGAGPSSVAMEAIRQGLGAPEAVARVLSAGAPVRALRPSDLRSPGSEAGVDLRL